MTAIDFPASPVLDQIFDRWQWDGAKWLMLGASGPAGGGRVAYAQVVASQGSIGATVVDITGLTVSWVAQPGHIYKTTALLTPSSTVANDDFQGQIADGANAVKQAFFAPVLDPQSSLTAMWSVVESGLSGTIVRKVRALRTAGTGTITNYAAAGNPAWILVEDVTPTGLGGPEIQAYPLGKMAYYALSANISGITTATQFLTCSFIADPTRAYRTSWYVGALSSVNDTDWGYVKLLDAAGAMKQQMTMPKLSAVYGQTWGGSVVESGLSGATTRRMTVERLTGTGTITITTSATAPTFILVEDIGPA